MTLKLTAASFLNGVRHSGLVAPEPLEAMLREMRAAGSDINDAHAIAAELVRRDLVTQWQAEKLLQGRHKGFFLGRYRLLRLLGTGQMSAVYLGRHIYMEHLVAIKVLPADKVGDTSYLGRFYREAKAVAALNHPNIIRAFDVDKQVEAGTDIHFFVMEYIDGKPLTQLIQEKEDHRLDLITAVDVIRQAAEGLAHAHNKNLVHRDIKPDNLLITPAGEVKILDLGLARFFKTTDEESLTLKHDERVIGTADYLAPEQAIDSHSVDSRADIYGLGCTFYCALTGHPPFTEGTLVQRLMAHQSQPVPPVTNERPDVPESLTKVLDRMLAKKREDRYQTGRDLADDLTAWLFEHAPHEWKEKHLPMYATLRLKNILSSTPDSKAAAETTPPTVHSGLGKPKSSATMKTAPPTKSTLAEPSKPRVARLGKPMAAPNQAATNGLIGIARRHPAAAVVVSLLAAALLIAASVFFLRPPNPVNTKDHSQATTAPRQSTAQVQFFDFRGSP